MHVNPMTLRHCQQVTIHTGLVGPGTLTIDAPAGGPGVINVTDSAGMPINGPVTVPSGGPVVIPLANAADIVLHYVAANGAGSVDIDLHVN